jgi:hypothetical protein
MKEPSGDEVKEGGIREEQPAADPYIALCITIDRLLCECNQSPICRSCLLPA